MGAFALRMVTVCHGGQLFWPDEGRYGEACQAADFFLKSRFHDGLALLFSHADHLAFRVFAVFPALVELAFHAPTWVPAAVFAAVSTAVIVLVGGVARAAGADDMESVLATFLAAGTNCLFYYARSFFPYDLSLVFGLIALIYGLRPDGPRRQSLVTGLYSGLCFLTYNGYWTLASLVLVLHALAGTRSWQAIGRRAGAALLGFLIPVGAAVAASGLLGFNLWSSFIHFAGTVIEGDYGVAWRFVWQYLWASEHTLVVIWWAAVLSAAIAWIGRGEIAREKLWLIAVLYLYAALVIPSDMMRTFAISGRHVRILTPFLSLLLASVLAAQWRAGGLRRVGAAVLCAGVAVQAAVNFWTPLCQVYPDEFYRMAVRRIQRNLRTNPGPYAILNCHFLHNPTWASPTPPGDVVIFQRPHPFAFQPFLFEGYNEKTRAEFLRRNLTMRVVRIPARGPTPDGYPGVVRLTLDPPDFKSNEPEALVTTGVRYRGDVLFLDHVDSSDIVVGLDHWGAAPIRSSPFHIDRTKPHTFVISMGSLLPPEGSEYFRWHPDWRSLKHRLFVSCDGKVLLDGPAAFHRVKPATITFGLNLIQASTAIPAMNSIITSFDRVTPAAILSPEPSAAAVDGFPGVVRMVLRYSGPYNGLPEPLVSSGANGRGDVLFLRHPDPTHVVIGLDHWGASPTVSKPIPFDRRKPHELVISMGCLFPPAGSECYRRHPDWKVLKHRLYVSWDGRVILDVTAAFYEVSPNTIAFGLNPIGASTATATIDADVTEFGFIGPETVSSRLVP